MGDALQQLRDLPVRHDFFVGVDSDGSVFDTMELKQKECFCPCFIQHFGLQAASRFARQVWEFVNLYSDTRGCNRYVGVQGSHRLMREWDVFRQRGLSIPELPSLKAWIAESSALGLPSLRSAVEATGDTELRRCLAWSEDVDARIEEMVHGVGPFPGARESLEKLRQQADVIVVSGTPIQALRREWQEHGLEPYVDFIAGQEAGRKRDHLICATDGKYAEGNVLLVGDAPKDRDAAHRAGALFYPIVPGKEEASWQRFRAEALERFYAGEYAGAYERKRLAEFDRALPECPPWRRSDQNS